MSRPQNRLSSYRSYSYHHVLAMCSDSDTAEALASSTGSSVWDHATSQTAIGGTFPKLGKYAPKKANTYNSAGKVVGTTNGQYCILINGMTDAAYTITHAEWMCSTAADAVHGDRTTSVATEGSIQISEPKGVVFLDQIIKCCIALGVDASQVVFVLKTFFVGYRHTTSDGDTVDYINDIPPVLFIVYDVTGSFTESGGTYKMEFVSCVNGATRLPQYSKVAKAINIQTQETLVKAIADLQKDINANYDKYFKCVVDTLTKALTDDNQNPANYTELLRRVDYQIQLASPYTDPQYAVHDAPPQVKDTVQCNTGTQYHAQPNTSIESAIHDIMMMSSQVKKDMNDGRAALDGSGKIKKYEYKVHTALKSTTGSNGRKQYTVIYRIEPFEQPRDVATDFTQYQGGDVSSDPKLKNNIIEFDYIYTGKNIDILEFDMKVNMGMAYLQTATISNSYKSSLNAVSTSKVNVPPASQQTSQGRMGSTSPMEVPILFGTELQIPSARNRQSAQEAGNAAYNLSKHSSLEMAEAVVKIIGNTKILGTLNGATQPGKLGAGSSATPAPNAQGTPAEANFTNWSYAPAFVKINVKMPANNDDISLMSGNAGIDYATNFWFNGYYYVYAITNSFDEGEFTQTLNMIAVPPASIFKTASGSTPSSSQLTFSSQVDNCFDHVPGCQSSSTPVTSGTSAGTAVNNTQDCAAVQKAADDKKQPGCDPATPTVAPTK